LGLGGGFGAITVGGSWLAIAAEGTAVWAWALVLGCEVRRLPELLRGLGTLGGLRLAAAVGTARGCCCCSGANGDGTDIEDSC
jgi:hypothetical protein